MAETEQHAGDVYADLCENILAMPVIRGQKTDKEKFARRGSDLYHRVHDARPEGTAGRHQSTTLATASPRPLTSPLPIRTTSRLIRIETSWGLSTRIIGGIIMTHGDNNGLVLPPGLHPIQVIVSARGCSISPA